MRLQRTIRSQKGFTLIELLTVIGIIGILAGLSIVSFSVYRSKASYAVAFSQLKNVKTVMDATLVQPDMTFAPVPYTEITAVGPITDPAVVGLLPQVQMGQHLKLAVEFDPNCTDGSCNSEFLEVRHCKGEEYAQWIRAGDGVEQWVERIVGSGCS